MGEDDFIQSSAEPGPEERERSERRERTDRRISDRRSQERRVQPRRQGEEPAGGGSRRAWLLPSSTVLAGLIGLAAGFGLSRFAAFGTVHVKESAFGLDAARSISRGRDFSGLKEMGRWSAAERADYHKALDALNAGQAGHAGLR